VFDAKNSDVRRNLGLPEQWFLKNHRENHRNHQPHTTQPPLGGWYSYVSDVFGRPAQMPDKLALARSSKRFPRFYPCSLFSFLTVAGNCGGSRGSTGEQGVRGVREAKIKYGSLLRNGSQIGGSTDNRQQ